MAREINLQERKLHKLSQELVDSTFGYLKAYRNGTVFQKSTAKKKLLNRIEALHEFLEGSGKLIKIKPPKRVTTYRTESKMVHIIGKE